MKKIWHIYGALFSHKEKWNNVICKKMNGIGNHDKQDKPIQNVKYYIFSLVCGIQT
jgi:hypothetical protein